MVPILAVLAVVLLLTLGESHELRIPGPDDNHNYKVAVSNFPLTDIARKDPYRPNEDRRLMVSLFMPVAKDSCLKECENMYMPPNTAAIANEQFIVGGKRDANAFDKVTYTVCCESADNINAGNIPVVVLEPHVDTSRLLYTNMARFVSANGAAVVLLDHPGDASIVQFSPSRSQDVETIYNSGTVPLSNYTPLTAWNTTISTALTTRISDINFALSQLNNLTLLRRQFPNHHFSTPLNTTSHGIIGHGLGGTVATSFSLSHPSTTLFSINLAGTPPLLTTSTRNTPLYFFGRRTHRREHDIHWPTTWSHLTGPATEFDVADADMFDFSDLPAVLELAGKQGRGVGGGKENVSLGMRSVLCFVENIVKGRVGLHAQGVRLGDCVRWFGGVVPYTGDF